MDWSRLQSYFGSAEEIVLREYLEDIKNRTLINIVIRNCNAMKPVAFSKADVLLEDYVSVRSNMLIPRFTSANLQGTRPNYKAISYQQLLKEGLIDEVARNGLAAVPVESIPKFLCLLEFMKNIKHHQEAICSVLRVKKHNTSLCEVLAEHFFSKLVPSQKYFIDENVVKKHDTCPCEMNCKSKIRTGNTAIGSGLVWHGYADIFIDQTVAVSVIEDDHVDDVRDDSDTAVCDNDTDDDDDEDINTDATINCILTQKRKRIDNDNNQNTKKTRKYTEGFKSVDVKNKYATGFLLDLNVIDQLIAEAITNSFAQVNRNASLKGRLIPTFGCSQEHLLVLMYDPENDILLHSAKLIKLWGFPEELELHAVIQVWLFLNFTTFIQPDVSTKYEFRKAMFHECVEDFLTVYKEASYNEKLKPADTNFYAEFVLPYHAEGAELVTKKTK